MTQTQITEKQLNQILKATLTHLPIIQQFNDILKNAEYCLQYFKEGITHLRPKNENTKTLCSTEKLRVYQMFKSCNQPI